MYFDAIQIVSTAKFLTARYVTRSAAPRWRWRKRGGSERDKAAVRRVARRDGGGWDCGVYMGN